MKLYNRVTIIIIKILFLIPQHFNTLCERKNMKIYFNYNNKELKVSFYFFRYVQKQSSLLINCKQSNQTKC